MTIFKRNWPHSVGAHPGAQVGGGSASGRSPTTESPPGWLTEAWSGTLGPGLRPAWEYFRRANLTGLSFTSLVAMFEPLEVGLEASGVVFGDMGQCTKYSPRAGPDWIPGLRSHYASVHSPTLRCEPDFPARPWMQPVEPLGVFFGGWFGAYFSVAEAVSFVFLLLSPFLLPCINY